MTPFPRQLTWFTACIFSAALAAALVLLVREGAPPVGTLLVFASLVVLAAHAPTSLREGMMISPCIMVCMAAILVFVAEGSLLGVVIVGALTGARITDLRADRWGWLPFNFGLSGLAFLAMGAVLTLLRVSNIESTPVAVVVMVPGVLAYTLAAWTLMILSFACEGTLRPREVLANLIPASVDLVPFTVLGFLLGRLYLSLGAGVLVLIIVPIVVAREVFRSYMSVTEARDETVHMMIRALESKDHYTAGHAERVAKYAGYIGQEMALGPWRMERLHFAALMHDIGKLVVPNQILNKPGKLTEEEFVRMRVHEKVAVQMLSHIDFLRPVAHSGHSDQMRFNADEPDHPIEPYIVMIADAYDAMTSTRSYRKALPQEIAFQELRDKAGIQFHPECVEAFIHALDKRKEKHGAGYEEDVAYEHAPEVGVGSAGLGDLLKTE